MAIATISVNFASASEVSGAGTLTTVKSISPSVLKSALTSGSSFAWTIDVNNAVLRGNLGVLRPTSSVTQKAIHVGSGLTAPSTATANAILASTVGSGGVAAFIARNDTGPIENILSTATTGVVGTVTSHDLSLQTAGSTRVTVDTSGNVGVGIATSIASRLHVRNTTDVDIRIENAGAGGRTYRIISNSSGNLNLFDHTGSVSRLLLSPTSNPGSSLYNADFGSSATVRAGSFYGDGSTLSNIKNMASFVVYQPINGNTIRLFRPAYNLQVVTVPVINFGSGSGTATILRNGSSYSLVNGATMSAGDVLTVTFSSLASGTLNYAVSFGFIYT